MKITLLLALIIFTAVAANAQTKKDGSPDMRYKANKEIYSTPNTTSSSSSFSIPESNDYLKLPTTTTSSTVRPAYSGSTHSKSHKGTYIGATNSHHKNGKYVNPNSTPVGSNVYGTHKTTSTKRN